MSPPEAWGHEPWLAGSSMMLFVAELLHRVAPSENPGPHPGAAVHALGCGWQPIRHSCLLPTESNLETDSGRGAMC